MDEVGYLIEVFFYIVVIDEEKKIENYVIKMKEIVIEIEIFL